MAEPSRRRECCGRTVRATATNHATVTCAGLAKKFVHENILVVVIYAGEYMGLPRAGRAGERAVCFDIV